MDVCKALGPVCNTIPIMYCIFVSLIFFQCSSVIRFNFAIVVVAVVVVLLLLLAVVGGSGGGAEEAGDNPSGLQARGRVHPGHDAKLSQG